jgi:hypothetical protein
MLLALLLATAELWQRRRHRPIGVSQAGSFQEVR